MEIIKLRKNIMLGKKELSKKKKSKISKKISKLKTAQNQKNGLILVEKKTTTISDKKYKSKK